MLLQAMAKIVVSVTVLSSVVFLLLLASGLGGVFNLGYRRGDRVALGQKVYNSQCAKCHGANLEGQPNWQKRLPNGRLPAPPHDATGHTWHHADEIFVGITKHGLKPYAGNDYDSDMPAFESALSDDEIAGIWTYIKSKWPERERNYQATISSQYNQQKPSRPAPISDVVNRLPPAATIYRRFGSLDIHQLGETRSLGEKVVTRP